MARTKVSIGGQLCGSVQSGTRNGQWYTVKCPMPIRGDKVVLETTQNTYLSISGIEVYSATLKSGTMSSSIKRNIKYTKYNNYCVSASGKDLKQTKITGKQDLNACLAACVRNNKCSAGEWYAKGWNGSKCYHINTGMGNDRAAKGASGKRWRDAACYVRG